MGILIPARDLQDGDCIVLEDRSWDSRTEYQINSVIPTKDGKSVQVTIKNFDELETLTFDCDEAVRVMS